jgi:hypothetical protein
MMSSNSAKYPCSDYVQPYTFHEEDPFEDVRRAYCNGNKWNQFASNYSEFISKMFSIIQETMNTTVVGQEIMEQLAADAIRSGLTTEAWQQKKVEVMKLLFFLAVDSCTPIKQELARHTYNELRK